MKVLDLFCGAGGAAMGLHRAWPDAEIIGIDNRPQPCYPFRFIQADAMTFDLNGYDFIWASPPCQRFSALNNRFNRTPERAPDYIGLLRERLETLTTPYVIENVVGAPLRSPLLLCGSMFDLRITGRGYLRRHRLFECSWLVVPPRPCDHSYVTALGVYGHGKSGFKAATGERVGGVALEASAAKLIMGIDWMNRDALAQAIPPAYSRYIALQYQQVRAA